MFSVSVALTSFSPMMSSQETPGPLSIIELRICSTMASSSFESISFYSFSENCPPALVFGSALALDLAGETFLTGALAPALGGASYFFYSSLGAASFAFYSYFYLSINSRTLFII